MSNHKSTTTVRELLRRRSCLTANLVVFTRHIVGFLVPCNPHLPIIPLFVIRYGACRRSGRRQSAWTWPLQRKVIHDSIKLLTGDAGSGTGPLNRNVIHDTIESLNEDAGLGWALSPVLARHIATYSVCVFHFFTNMRLLRRFRRHPGRLLFGGRVAAHPRRHCPSRVGCPSGKEWLLSPEGTARKALLRAIRRLPPSLRAAGRCCCVSIIAGPGVRPQTGKTHDSCIISSLFSVNTSGRALGCCAERAALACWRSAWGVESLQDTRRDLAHSRVGP